MKFDTVQPGGSYKPKNVVAVWVAKNDGTFDGTFVKTILRYANSERSALSIWNEAAGSADTDAVMGATRPNHFAPTPMTATWDLKDKAGNVVPDGDYLIKLECADGSRRTYTFGFTKDSVAGTRTNPGDTYFKNISITYAPPAPANTAPVSQSQNPSAVDGNALSITLSATDAEDNAVTYQIVSQPLTGRLMGTPPALTYLPRKGLNGADSFTFNANDGLLTGNTATVTVTLVFTDSDGDGIPDSWENTHGMTNGVNDRVVDFDFDGSSNYAEYVAGTDPVNSNSVFAVTVPRLNGGSAIVIQWSSVQDHYYTVQSATNLITGWSTLTGNNVATPPVNSYTGVVDQANAAFYRIRLDP